MDENGITIESAKDIKLEAKGKLTIGAKQDIELKSSTSATINAPKVDIR